MNIHCIRHEPYEGLASIESWARSNGHKISYTRTYLHQRFPDDTSFDLLIIMGGSASVYDSQIKALLLSECRFIQKAIDAGKIVLGICLGAQMLAHTCGARVYPAPAKEIGWFPVFFNRKELTDCSFLPEQINTFHWHGDTFDLPQGAIRVASSDATPNQGFMMGDKILALQFHLEMNLAGIKKLIKACASDLRKPEKNIQSADSMLSRMELVTANNDLMFTILDFLTKSRNVNGLKAAR